LLADEGDEEELAVAFDLEGYGVAGFLFGQGLAKTFEGGDGSAVHSVDDIAGLQRNFGGASAGRARGNDDASGNAEIGEFFGEIESEFKAEHVERTNEIFYGIDFCGEAVFFVLFFDESNVERNVLGAAENENPGVVAGFVKIEAERKKRKSAGGNAVDSEDDVLNFHAGGVGGAAGHNVGNDDAKIAWETEARSEFGSDGLNESADGRMMDVAELQELRISGDDDSGGDGEA
jgi:hypothetical protein